MARRPRNIDEVQSARLQSRAILAGIILPPGYELLVTDSRCGRHRSATKTCTVPLWAVSVDFTGKVSTDFELYYAAHEAAHAWVCHNNERDSGPHGPNFYKHFKRLCDPALWHHELGYKTREAKRAGIDPNPKVNAIAALPDAPAAVRDTVDAMVSKTPRRTYRPSMTDEQIRADAIKRDPRLKKLLANVPAVEVASYVRGWFQPKK